MTRPNEKTSLNADCRRICRVVGRDGFFEIQILAGGRPIWRLQVSELITCKGHFPFFSLASSLHAHLSLKSTTTFASIHNQARATPTRDST